MKGKYLLFLVIFSLMIMMLLGCSKPPKYSPPVFNVTFNQGVYGFAQLINNMPTFDSGGRPPSAFRNSKIAIIPSSYNVTDGERIILYEAFEEIATKKTYTNDNGIYYAELPAGEYDILIYLNNQP